MALILVAWVSFAPAMAAARPLRGERPAEWKRAVAAVQLWWGFFTRGVVEPAQAAKNGCGIDPNGTPLCGTNPGGGGMGGSGLQSGTEDPVESGN